jgi:hypothetical protein
MIGRGLEGSGRGIIKVLSRNLPGGTERNYENTVSRTYVPTETRREHSQMQG